ncbi:hypothetical protein [Candidatus Similichlamydia epinepheli]|uniref:hypothetical protein n=1 Tax=Candidatus Similichlamydia epinepheli TaxID=1903953 RepID=UPI000D3C8977|nr:hypothetical protein [Candidatus Similichlamydia epinepheli]
MRNQNDLFNSKKPLKEVLKSISNFVLVYVGFYNGFDLHEQKTVLNAIRKRFKAKRVAAYFCGKSIRKGHLFAFVFFPKTILSPTEKNEMRDLIGTVLLQTISKSSNNPIKVKLHK